MNHLKDISVVKNDVWAIQNRIRCPHTMRVCDFNTLRRSKSFLPKNAMKKCFFPKNWSNFPWSCQIGILSFQWSIHTPWTFKPSYFQYYPLPLSLVYLPISDALRILETHENSRFARYSLKYLSDHLSNKIKWK